MIIAIVQFRNFPKKEKQEFGERDDDDDDVDDVRASSRAVTWIANKRRNASHSLTSRRVDAARRWYRVTLAGVRAFRRLPEYRVACV